MRRSPSPCRRYLALLPFLLSACDCAGPGHPPGPAHGGFESVAASTVAALGVVPFDVDRRDLVGPDSHDAHYGKLPEIVVAPGDGYFDAVLRSASETPRAFLVRVTDTSGSLALSQAFEIPTLGLVLGFVRGADGSFYYATGTPDDGISRSHPQPNEHRRNVVRVYRVAPSGETLFDVDLDPAREDAFPDAEPLVNPGVASTARLALAGTVLALVAGNNTAPDSNGTRHQKAVSTYLDATTGSIRRPSGIWVSHSFDERYLAADGDLFELHLGDAYPRAIVVSRIRDAAPSPAVQLFRSKGALGANNTHARLGGLARVSAGANAGSTLVLFATERTTGTEARVSGSRDLCLVRLVPDFASGQATAAVDATFGTTWDVTSSGESQTNRARFLTDFQGDGGLRHAERPKLVALPGGGFIVLFERWKLENGTQAFEGTYALRIDDDGDVVAAPERVSDHHLPRGDDAFAWNGSAAWLTGDEVDRTLMLHVVAPDLSIAETVVP